MHIEKLKVRPRQSAYESSSCGILHFIRSVRSRSATHQAVHQAVRCHAGVLVRLGRRHVYGCLRVRSKHSYHLHAYCCESSPLLQSQ